MSLSPAVTETLFALDLGPSVVGVSDFCQEPPEVQRLARVGTVFNPRYEAIAAARPTNIVTERIDGSKANDLGTLGPVLSLPWLSYDDVLRSTQELGRRFNRQPQAAVLVADYDQAFRVPTVQHAPRVLLALAHVPGQLSEVWYVRRNSIHGRALSAAGAVNAVVRDVYGQPRLGLEQVFALDPDVVIVLEAAERENRALLEDWQRLTAMRAVREGRVALVAAPELQVPGPRVTRLVARLRAAILTMSVQANRGDSVRVQGVQTARGALR